MTKSPINSLAQQLKVPYKQKQNTMTQINSKNNNLIVVTRQDLSPGYIAVQSIHAAIEFTQEHPELFNKWFNFSKNVSLLAVPNEDQLKFLISKLAKAGIKYSIFIEPDIDNQVTAITIEPCETARKMCSSIPLALKQYNTPYLVHKHSVNGREAVA